MTFMHKQMPSVNTYIKAHYHTELITLMNTKYSINKFVFSKLNTELS